jgi:hypothetical protein
MTRAACEIAGFEDEEVLNKIDKSSLSDFKNELREKDSKLYKIVDKSTKPLSNKTVDEYNNLINNMRLNYKTNLTNAYGDKESEIDKRFNEFKTKIEELTKVYWIVYIFSMVFLVTNLPNILSPGVFSRAERAFLSNGCSYSIWSRP